MMWNRYQSYRGGIRFFPHIFPIAFPLIFPLGVGLAFFVFRLIFPLLVVLFIAALIFFVVRTVQLGSMDAAWNSLRGTGLQWQQRFTSQPQQPYYQPSSQAGQPQQPYYQPSQPAQPQQPYYQPSQPAQSQQSYEQGYYTQGQQEQMPPM